MRSWGTTGVLVVAGSMLVAAASAATAPSAPASSTAAGTGSVLPPAAPTGLTATAVSGSRINLAWTDNAATETFFKLQRRSNSGAWTGIFLPRNTESYADTGLPPGEHCYRIRSHTNSEWSSYTTSSPACVTLVGSPPPPPSGPAPPSNLQATQVSGSRIDLAWVDNASNETFFKLQRRTDGGGWTGIFLPQNATSYADKGLSSGEHCYRLRSHTNSAWSAYVTSTPACITLGGGGPPPPTPPAAPTDLAIVNVTGNNVHLSWKDNADDELGFKMQRRQPGGSWQGIWHFRDVTSYVDTNVPDGTWCYRVRSYTAATFSEYDTASPDCIVVGADGELALEPVITSGLVQPVFVTAPFGDDRLFIVERRGLIRIVEDGALLPEPFLDIDDRSDVLGEGGLLGLAFAPDYATSGLFYVNYTDDDPDDNNIGDTVLSRFQVSSDPDVADAASEEVLLEIVQPFANHNGGTVAFGLDGYLYIGMGDGGSGNDPGNRSQDDSSIHGKMLRIDVSGGLGSGYSIPPDNPDPSGATWLPESWSKGWRNPYRFSFDRVMGDLYVGDVGQNAFEEVSVEAFGDGGNNYGWRRMEGFACNIPGTNCNDGSLTLPVYDYGHINGRCSVTGGYVYRGADIPAVVGHYFFGDFCSGEVFSFVWDGSGGYSQFTDRTTDLSPIGLFRIAGFGEDGFGELYIIDIGGRIFKIVSGS